MLKGFSAVVTKPFSPSKVSAMCNQLFDLSIDVKNLIDCIKKGYVRRPKSEELNEELLVTSFLNNDIEVLRLRL